MLLGKELDFRFRGEPGQEVKVMWFKPVQKHEMFAFFAGKSSIDCTDSGRPGGRPGTTFNSGTTMRLARFYPVFAIEQPILPD